ncbi:MAG: PilN domain-containing protein [Gammaproteobacteria bacterium]
MSLTRIEKINVVTTLIRFVGLTLFALVIWHFSLVNLLDDQLNKNAQLKIQLAQKQKELEAFKKRQEKIFQLESQLRFISSLRQQNNQAAHILDGFVKTIPHAIVLNQLQRQGVFLTVDGSAEIDSNIIQFMENITKSTLFSHPMIIQLGAKQSPRYFQMRVGIK